MKGAWAKIVAEAFVDLVPLPKSERSDTTMATTVAMFRVEGRAGRNGVTSHGTMRRGVSAGRRFSSDLDEACNEYSISPITPTHSLILSAALHRKVVVLSWRQQERPMVNLPWTRGVFQTYLISLCSTPSRDAMDSIA